MKLVIDDVVNDGIDMHKTLTFLHGAVKDPKIRRLVERAIQDLDRMAEKLMPFGARAEGNWEAEMGVRRNPR